MTEQERLRAVDYWRTLLRQALADNSTVDFYDITPAGVDNLALIAAQAVVAELTADASKAR
jgi:hypothetical protein